MAIINLRDYYPFYTSDCFMEVSEEVAEMFKEFDRKEAAYHGKSKEMITASVFRITSADNSIIQQKTCKAKLYRFFGTPEGTRTPDLLVRSDAIFFSYLFIKCKKF